MAVPTMNEDAIAWTDLGLSPVALDLGFFELRWYSLAYLAGIFVGNSVENPLAAAMADTVVP